jgi:hypothetical protein
MWIPAVLCGWRCFSCDQSLDEVLPGGKDNVGADGVEILKETFARPKRLACLLPECFQAVAGGVEGEGQQIIDLYPKVFHRPLLELVSIGDGGSIGDCGVRRASG